MKSQGLAELLPESGRQAQSRAPVIACLFCRKRLAGEYFFTCLKCDASYCYIHISRHQPAMCGRQAERRRRAQQAPSGQRQTEALPLVLAGSSSSANV